MTTDLEKALDDILADSPDRNVVVGPVLRQASAPVESYFMIATCKPGRGFYSARIVVEADGQREIIVAVMIRQFRGWIIHLCNEEIKMIRLCETLWPGEHISALREMAEAELESREATRQ